MREAAKGQDCTVNAVGVCNYDPATTVFAHLSDESKGMGTKSDDLSGCDACHACHDWIDRRRNDGPPEEEREWYMRRAQVRTLRRRIEQGIITIKGHKAR